MEIAKLLMLRDYQFSQNFLLRCQDLSAPDFNESLIANLPVIYINFYLVSIVIILNEKVSANVTLNCNDCCGDPIPSGI